VFCQNKSKVQPGKVSPQQRDISEEERQRLKSAGYM